MPKHLFICAVLFFCFSGGLWAQSEDGSCEKHYFSGQFGQVGRGASPSMLELDDGNMIVSWFNYYDLNVLKLSPAGEMKNLLYSGSHNPVFSKRDRGLRW